MRNSEDITRNIESDIKISLAVYLCVGTNLFKNIFLVCSPCPTGMAWAIPIWAST